jgi:hypothetical protein
MILLICINIIPIKYQLRLNIITSIVSYGNLAVSTDCLVFGFLKSSMGKKNASGLLLISF